MPDKCTLVVNGQAVEASVGTCVMAVLSAHGPGLTRLSVRGEARTAFCGMGVCQECRVRINGVQLLACQTLVAAGMQVHTATLESLP